MGTSSIEQLFELAGIKPGAVPTTGAAPVPPATPQTFAPEEIDIEPSSTSSYMGNLGRLFLQAANPFDWPEFGPEFRSKTLREVASNFRAAGERGLEYIAETLSSPRGAFGIPLNVQADLGEAAIAVGQSSKAIVQNPTQTIPQLLQGLAEEFIEPTLTAVTGNKIVGDMIVPATEAEMAQGIQSTASLGVAGGVYSKLGKAAATFRPGVATTRMERVGGLARNIGYEARAQAASGMAQEMVAHPDEFDLESVINNVANPLVLFTSVTGGIARTRGANRIATEEFNLRTAIDNEVQLNDLPTAKQIAVNANSSVPESFAAVDALATSDTWLEAAFKKLKKAGDGTFMLLDATADQVEKIYKKYVGELVEVKPKIDKVGPIFRSKQGVHIYFEDNFDNLVYNSKNLAQVAEQYGLSLNSLKGLRDELEASVKNKNIPVQTTELLQGQQKFKYKTIPAASLPEAGVRPRVYISRTGTMLATVRPLTQEAFKKFELTGFLPNEAVTFRGMEVNVKAINKNGSIQIVDRAGKTRGVKPEQLDHRPDGTKTVWSAREYGNEVIDEALRFVEAESKTKQTFSSLMQRFGVTKGWDAGDVLNFENLLYRTVAERAERLSYGPQADPLSYRMLRDKQLLDDVLNREALTLRQSIEARLDANGYRIDPVGKGYKLTDIRGVEIGTFRNMDELFDMAKRDFVDVNVPDIQPTNFPVSNPLQPLSPRMQAVHRYMDRKGWTQKWLNFKAKPIVATGLRKIDKAVEDSFERAGLGAQGFDLSRKMEIQMNSINAAEQGIYKPIMTRVNNLVESSKVLTPEQKKLVTRALEQRSFKELADALTEDQKFQAEMLLDIFRKAGGNSVVKADYQSFLDGKDATGKIFDLKDLAPERRAAVDILHKMIGAGAIQDERMLRYIDAIEDGVDLNAEDWIATQPKWDKNTQRVYEQAREFYREAKDIFQIEGEITGYAPWITKWRGVNSIYNDARGPESSFVHELRRIGITDIADRVLDIDELAYRYAKTGIHHKSPVAGRPGVTTGQLMGEINRDIATARRIGVDVTQAERWVQNLKGVPSLDEAAERIYIQKMEEMFQKNYKGSGGDTAMNVISLFKLGGRPILAVRDAVSSYGLGLLYGVDAANAVIGITPDKLRRIQRLSELGELPQFNANEILSRMGRGRLTTATDIGMQLSGQQFAYKVVAGNMYLHTYDKVIDVLRRNGTNTQKIIDELGPLLDTGSRASQEWFLQTIQRDPVSAAKGLAARNAHGLANRFGRLNNPLAWQSSFGRAFGQFGSWGLNAMTTVGESIANSNSVRSAAGKMAKLAAYNGAIAYVGYQAGVNVSNWWLNPLSMFPTGGPLLHGISDAIQGGSMMFNTDEDVRERGLNQLYNSGTLLTPTLFMDLYESAQILTELGDNYAGLMRAAGMKMTDEYMGGYTPEKLNIPKNMIQGALNVVTPE